MPVEELASGLFSVIARFFGYVLIDIMLEILVKGTGYLIIKALPFSNQKEINPDGFQVVIAGFAFWASIIALVFCVLRNMVSV